MAVKKTVRSRAGNATIDDSTPPKAVSKGRSSSSRKAAVPIWVWCIAGFSLLAIAGRVFMPAANNGKGQNGRSKAKRKAGKADSSSSMESIELLLELQDMTNKAEEMRLLQQLDGPAAREMQERLNEIETHVDTRETEMGQEMSHSIRSVISIIRGTLGVLAKEAGVEDTGLQGSQKAYTYADAEYWDGYYNKTTKGELYDWYGSWDDEVQAADSTAVTTLGKLLRLHLDRPSPPRILMLGCGNSDLSEKMYHAGFEDITNVDISQKLLDNLRSRLAASMPRMRWLHMNASDLRFDESAFDVVIDKGTLDALELDHSMMLAAAKEGHRVLASDGVFLSITFRTADKRVENELRTVGEWSNCQTSSFQRLGISEAKSEYHLHACTRR